MYNEKNEQLSELLEAESCENETCIPYEQEIKVERLARAYVPFQKYCSTFEPMESLIKGTVFPELSMPYIKNQNNCDKCKTISEY